MKIVITAPSLDEHRNVSGISSVVRQIIEHSSFEYSHFQAGREDGEPAGAVWLARQLALPLRMFARILNVKPDVVHINTALTDLSIWRDAALSMAARLAGCPVVLGIHGGKYLLNEFDNAGLKRAVASMVKTAATLIVLSELERERIDSIWPGLDVRVLPNAVPPRRGGPALCNNTVPVIIFLGRLHESKGLDQIVKACTVLRRDGVEFRFRCFGDGPMKDVFLEQMRGCLGDRFLYGGVVTDLEKYSELDKADIFLLPSIYGEGLPVALLEAMAAGCIVVASEMASVASVIDQGVNGYLVEPGNTGDLVRRLRSVLHDRGNWDPVRRAAIETVRRRFAITDYIHELEDIYRETRS
jgi:glycosyltransferase involved in cell wall biosynthesis